jgi:glucose/arabinose dehydrogenase
MSKLALFSSAAVLYLSTLAVASSPVAASRTVDPSVTPLEAVSPMPTLAPQQRREGRSQDRGRGQRPQRGPNIVTMFNETCARCHDETGYGGAFGTSSLITKELFSQDHDRRFFDSIKNGTDSGMDPFGDAFIDEEIWGFVVYVRELQAKGLREEFGSPTPAEDGVYTSQRAEFRLEEVIVGGMRVPWSLDWLADGRMLVTNRGGTMSFYEDNEKIVDVEGLPPSVEQGQGGLMDVRVHPTNGWIYLSVADPAEEGGPGQGAMTKVYRGKIDFSQGGAAWTNTEVIWETDQQYYRTAGVHFGCKIVFDGEGHVFFSVGERGTNMGVQESVMNPYGKIMRLNLDGTIPDDNPIPGSATWTTGHRNPQGLAFDLEGNLWGTEHGPRGGDEVNLIVPTSNYGWPVVASSINYSGSPFRVPFNGPNQNFTMPAFRWLPSIGASGLDIANGPAFPGWEGDLLAGGLAGQNLDRIRVKDGMMVEREELLQGIGRVRDIRVHRDGTVYLVMNMNRRGSEIPDKILRLVPVQ